MRYASIQKSFPLLVLGPFVALLVFISAQANQANKEHSLDIVQEHGRSTTDLANTLVFIATEYQIPMVAELTAADDPKMDIPAGRTTARQLLDYLVGRAKEYDWKEHDGIIHFYRKTLLNAPADPFNLKLKSFELPKDVGQLKISLPMRIHNASQGFLEGGGAISTFQSAELAQLKLPDMAFREVTGRDILLKAVMLQPQFCSIIVLPDSYPEGPNDLEFGFKHWFWFAVKTKERPIIQ